MLINLNNLDIKVALDCLYRFALSKNIHASRYFIYKHHDIVEGKDVFNSQYYNELYGHFAAEKVIYDLRKTTLASLPSNTDKSVRLELEEENKKFAQMEKALLNPHSFYGTRYVPSSSTSNEYNDYNRPNFDN